MKTNYLKPFLTLLFLLIFTTLSSQNESQIKEVRQNSNLDELRILKQDFELKYNENRSRAESLAKQLGWNLTYIDDDGSYNELISVTEDNKPIYYKTFNTDAAISTRANWLHNGGGLGLNVEGQGMTAYVWDGGLARLTHQEFDGEGGSNRFSIGDSSDALNFHGAHVMGTIISSGLNPSSKGMAPQAKGVGFDWGNDVSEAAASASNGMLLSNHSYGYRANGIPDSWFGAYIGESRDWDALMYNAPYYLQVAAAGNDGNDNTSNGDPLDGNSSFDKISGMQTSKNSLIVANGRDASIDSNGDLLSVVINSGSSEGPMDDYRIKPDITGNGTGLFSTYESSDDAYSTISGTSMASPNVMGSLLLLQQHYSNLNGRFMRSATLKGLALHTADDVSGSVGLEGPDAVYGWGLMNTKRAAQAITKQGLESVIKELEISQGETLTFTVTSDGLNPLLASISWTDLPGELSSGVNDTTPVLVNDLDVVVNNETDSFLPWLLTGVDSNAKGDNIVDPFERVDIEQASGSYIITVSHKGTLSEGPQKFSLVVTGIVSDFTITSTGTLDRSVCSSETPSFDFSYRQSISTTTSLSIENLPSGVTAEFSSDTLSADGDFTVTFGNLDTLEDGVYSMDLVADNGSKEERRTVNLELTKPITDGFETSLVSPQKESKGVELDNLQLEWDETEGATSYFVEVSNNPSFQEVLYIVEETGLLYDLPSLESNTIYYWRVKAKNICQEGSYSEVYSFQTITEQCSQSFEASITNNAISTGIKTLSVSVDESIIVSRAIVNLDLEHEAVGDLKIELREPASLGSSKYVLIDSKCGDNDDMLSVSFDDFGEELQCNDSTPTLNGSIKPEESLSVFSGLDVQGAWRISIADFVSGNNGTINSASITFCSTTENTDIPNFNNNTIEIVANGTTILESTDIEASTSSEEATKQVYTLVELPRKGLLMKGDVSLSVGDTFTQEDVNLGVISFTNNQSSLFSDTLKVDITNSLNGWLANQVINLSATTLSSGSFDLLGLTIYPNPSNGEMSISFLPESNEKASVQIYDLQGRNVFVKEFEINGLTFKETIDVEDLSGGIYLLRIRQKEKSMTKRIVITK